MDRRATIDLNDVIQHPGRTVDFEVTVEGLDDPEIALVTPITGILYANADGNLLRLWGEFSAVVAVGCDRCGEDTDLPVKISVREAFPLSGTPTAHRGAGAYVDDEEEPYPLFEENRLLVDDLLRQLLIIEIPMHPVCSEGCKGLCEHCGHNLNEGPCDCASEPVNPAFRRLAETWEQAKPTQ